MSVKNIKNELQSILQGKSPVSYGKPLQAITSYLRESQRASSMVAGNKQSKVEETKKLIEYVNQRHLWNCDIDFTTFLSAGAEQRVYIQNNKKVFKLNDAIYYTSWVDYFENLLLHNYFFPDTSYNLIGFYKSDKNVIYAFVEQNYVVADQPTNVNRVKEFLLNNGFINIRNQDYYHPELGIILEDLHDENVLTANEILYFIDTVFYIKPEIFWN